MKKADKKSYEISAPKLTKEALENLRGLFVLIGKPFYFVLSRAFLIILFLLYVIGHTASWTFQKAFGVLLFLTKLNFPKIEFPKSLPLPKLTIRAPRFPFFNTKKVVLFMLPVVPFLVLIFIFYFFVLRDLPSPYNLITREIEVSTKIYDRNGVLLYKIYKDKNRTIVSLSQVPINVRLATLAAEDAEFYNHPGFSIRGILRALFRNLRTGEISGGSTITQQLVKNALLSPEKTILRKIREIVLSVEVELTFSKDQIFEMYLNEVSYGRTAYGIQEASRVYFGKDVADLTLAEAALLAGLPKSPTKFSPFGPNPESAFVRQKEVLRLMTINKFITSKDEDEAGSQRITFAPDKTAIKAPHFVMYVKSQLVEKYGEEVVEKGGLEVITTLDYKIQELAETVVKDEVTKLKNLHVGNGAALVLNPQTGEILAMVGSYDYFDIKNDGNVNVTTRPRQPGSSIKIVNYSYALSHGYTPATILDDSPVTFQVPGQPPYSPKNYDGEFRGKISLRSALAESRNIPAVKVLASYGVSQMIEQGKKMGITTWEDPSRFGLSLTLGGGEVKLLDLARAYATIANYGNRPEIISIVEVKNFRGKVLGKETCLQNSKKCEEEVVDPRVSYQLIDILKDNSARSPAFGSNSALVIPGHNEVAVKTGTSNDLKDNLTLGFNQKYLVATWVGNNNSSPMARIASGVTGASPIWNKIMGGLLASQEKQNWEVPKGLVQVSICTKLGTLACEGCPVKPEWFLEENKPTKACFSPGPSVQKDQILEPALHTENSQMPELFFPR